MAPLDATVLCHRWWIGKKKCCWSNLRPLTRRISSTTTSTTFSLSSMSSLPFTQSKMGGVLFRRRWWCFFFLRKQVKPRPLSILFLERDFKKGEERKGKKSFFSARAHNILFMFITWMSRRPIHSVWTPGSSQQRSSSASVCGRQQ